MKLKQHKNIQTSLTDKNLKKKRLKTLNIFQLIFGVLVFVAFVSVVLMGLLWVYVETTHAQQEIRNLNDITLLKQKERLKGEVIRILDYLEHKSSDTLISTDIQQAQALNYLKDIRFGKDGYVFINLLNGQALLYDGKRVEGYKNISNLTDPNGLKVFEKEKEMALLPNGGYFLYMFKKMNDSIPKGKISYVNQFKPWGWIVGTGDYLDNINEQRALLEVTLKQKLLKNIYKIIVVFFSVIVLAAIVAYFVARGVQHQFIQFAQLVKEAKPNQKNDEVFQNIFIRDLQSLGADLIKAEVLAKEFGVLIEESINEIYIYNQDDLHFVHANKGALENTGYTEQQIKEITPLQLMQEISKADFLNLLAPLKRQLSERVHFQGVIRRKNNTTYPVELFITTSVYNNKPVFVTFLYDISERKQTESKLGLSENRYSLLFENAPISLWEEDYSILVMYINEQIKNQKVTIEELFENSPNLIQRCADMVNVVDVNKQTIQLFEAETKENLLGNVTKIFTEDAYDSFKQSLFAFYNGKKEYSAEATNRSLKGKQIDLHIRWSFLQQEATQETKVILSLVDLTYLRNTEKELKASEQRFRSVFNNEHTIMFLVNPEDGSFIDVNPAAVNFYGFSREKFISELTVFGLNTLPQDKVQQNLSDITTGKMRSFTTDHRLKNGDIRQVEVYSGLVSYEKQRLLLSIVHDVTERQRAKQAIVDAKNKLESIFRAAPIGIGVVSEGVFTEVNERFCYMLKMDESELVNHKEAVLFPSGEEYNNMLRETNKQILARGTGTIETKLIRSDKKQINVLLSSTPLDISDLSKGITYTALDITERVLDLEELERHRSNLEKIVAQRTADLEDSREALLNLVDDLNLQSKKLEKANKRLEEINTELETFTYSVSHDLKAPLRGIDGYSQLLQESYTGETNPEVLAFLKNIRNSTRQMNLLIEDLLSYSRMERKGFQSVHLHLKENVEDILHQFSKAIEESKTQIEMRIPDAFVLSADKDGLNMVLRNLIDNALKFTAAQSKAKIEIGCSETPEAWRIFVKDNGIGFDMKYHDRIFNIFQRLHLAEEYEGTGIGLAMVSKAMLRMKGKVWAESKPNEGACFYLEINKDQRG